MDKTDTRLETGNFLPVSGGAGLFRRSGFDRRSGIDRRTAYSLKYLLSGKKDRRVNAERRGHVERRQGYVRVGRWSSLCSLFFVKLHY